MTKLLGRKIRRKNSILKRLFLSAGLCFSLQAAAGLKEDLSAQFKDQSKKQGIGSAALVIYQVGDDKPVFQEIIGDFSLDAPIAVASASKWLSAATMMALVDQKKLELGSTTGKILGEEWKDEKSGITLQQLLSFTSGLDPKHRCTLLPFASLKSCSSEIAKVDLVSKPGEAFNYGNTPMQVAGRMGEIVAGKSFADIFKENIVLPMGMGEKTIYYTMPRKEFGTQPLLAGGLVISTTDYVKFLKMLSQKGMFAGKRILSEKAIEQMEKDQFSKTTKVLYSPLKSKDAIYHYALGNWAESESIHSSAGTFGFFPWMDRKNKYFGIYATVDEIQTGQKTFAIVKSLRPTIEKLVKP